MLTGTYATSDGALVSMNCREAKLEGRLIALSHKAKVFGWRSGDVIVAAEFVDGQFVGTGSLRFVYDRQSACASRVVHLTPYAELQLVGKTLMGRLKRMAIADGCETIEAGWLPLEFKRQPFELIETADAIKLALRDSILFDVDRSDLKSSALQALRQAKVLVLDTQNYTGIVVEGHSDDRGTDAYNLQLSEERARVVVQWFVAEGVDSRLLRASGVGKRQPVAPNTSEANRARNRRVEVHLTKLVESSFPNGDQVAVERAP